MKNMFNKLNQIRNQKGVSVKEISKKIGIHPNTYYNWIYRKSSPTLIQFEAMCAILKINNLMTTVY